MSGIYNETYFSTRPSERERDGVLYAVKLVNKKTWTSECLKVGIAAGKDWRHVVKRSYGFKGYDLRIQRTWHSTLYRVWQVEQELHKEFSDDRFKPTHKFGGHTECFKLDSKILDKFPKKYEN
tara:strand:- start:535 stop:903 length:369 start_codon:yes stop_codon:yes gene_type:complete